MYFLSGKSIVYGDLRDLNLHKNKIYEGSTIKYFRRV